MNLTYTLTAGGYQVFDNGVLWVDQPFDPAKQGFEPFESPEAAEAAAQAFIAARTAEQPAA